MENTAANTLYDLLVTRNFEPEILDKQGKPVLDPSAAEMFSFDYKTDNHNYGTVVILLGAENDLQVFFGDNVGRSMEGDDKSEWYDFLHQLKNFATRNMLSFELNNINRLKYTMQGLAAIKEGLFEGYYGKKNVSYRDEPKQVRLMIKHNRNIDEGEARHRAIESLFIETADGERFKVPSRNLTHGRLLARHVAEGGNPYDAFGQHINNVVAEMSTLARFIRAARGREFTGDVTELVETAIRHYSELKDKAKRMLGQRGYKEERENFDPTQVTDSEVTTEVVRDMFIEKNIDHRIEEALPILTRLANTNKEPKMREADEFESWTNRVMEGTWSLPETPEQEAALKALMNKPLVVGPDAENATSQLYDLVGDDELFDRLGDLAEQNPNANCWDDPAVVDRLGELGVDITAMTGAESDDDGIVSDMDQDAEHADEEVDESALQAYLGNKKYGKEGMDALRKAGREHAGKEKMAQLRDKYDKSDEVDEGILDTAKKIGSRVFDKLGGGNDQELLDKLRKDAGLPPRMATPNKKDVEEDLDTDGVMMTKASNMSS